MPGFSTLLKRGALAAPVIVVLTIGILTSVDTRRTEARIAGLQSNAENALVVAQALNTQTKVRQPNLWIEVATLLSVHEPQHDALTIELLERALSSSPNNPRAWALLSFVYTRAAGEFTSAAETALRESHARCGFCDRELLKWRFTYALQHWERVSETSKLSAFAGADFLRWWYLEYEYLRDVRISAIDRDIPFDDYRRRVNTPVRSNELH